MKEDRQLNGDIISCHIIGPKNPRENSVKTTPMTGKSVAAYNGDR